MKIWSDTEHGNIYPKDRDPNVWNGEKSFLIPDFPVVTNTPARLIAEVRHATAAEQALSDLTVARNKPRRWWQLWKRKCSASTS